MTASGLAIGGLFSGYGGLEMGVKVAIGGRIAWHSEIEPGPCKVLAHHWPNVPNLGDITAIDWAGVEPVDVMCGGSPCQDVSSAGRRAGMRPGTRSGLWESMREGIAVVRPRLVVWENVRGVTNAEAHSDVEPCARCVGGGDDGPVLRALGRVLGDLADLGYDAQWHGLRAADVGAPHGRFRVFVVARDASESARYGTELQHLGARLVAASEPGEPAGAVVADASNVGHERRGPAWHGRTRPTDGSRLTVADTESNGRDEGWPESARLVGRSDVALSGDAAADTTGYEGRLSDRERVSAGQWGPYAAATARWERVLGRVAPAPTESGAKGNQRLSPRFVEWMMGLPAGHVTDPAIGLTRNEQLKALGNGVVPQQSEAAIRVCLTREGQQAA